MGQFLRIYPGETDFKEVSEKEFNRDIHPHDMEDMLGVKDLGLIAALEASIEVYDPSKKLVIARKWPAHSYTRWFARILRMLFSNVAETIDDNTSTPYTTVMATTSVATGQHGLVGNPVNVSFTHAALAIGQGSGTEDSGRRDLISPISVQDCRTSMYTTQEDTAAISMSINEGVTIAAPAGVTISEIGLFMWFTPFNVDPNNNTTQKRSLMAYDQVTPTVVSQGGVIVPKYTMTFTA